MRRRPWPARPFGRLLLLAISLGAVAAMVWGRWRRFEPRTVAPTGALEPRPVALAPGVYLLGEETPAAVYLVETGSGLVLIDSGLESKAASVIRQLRRLGFDEKELRAVLLTHIHADHSQGAAHLRGVSGAKIHAGASEAALLRAGTPRQPFVGTYYMPAVRIHPTPVDVEVRAGDVLEFSETRFKVIGAAGHTPGSVCYLLERADLRALFTGDLVLHLGAPAADILGILPTYLPPAYGGDGRSFLASLRRLRALPVPDLVLPGHPQMDLVPQSPRLSEQRWQALLDRGIGEMQQLVERYERDGAAFLDGKPRELLSGCHYLGDFGGQALYALAPKDHLFLFNAPHDPVWLDLLTNVLASRFKDPEGKPRKLNAVLLTSAEESARAGLAAVVSTTGCEVFAPDAEVEAVRHSCSPKTRVRPATEFAKTGLLEVQVMPLLGNGMANAAYRIDWGGKRILISGHFPLRFGEHAIRALINAVHGPRGNVADFLQSLDRLETVRPNLWLPAMPIQGQNANIYDNEWHQLLAELRVRAQGTARN